MNGNSKNLCMIIQDYLILTDNILNFNLIIYPPIDLRCDPLRGRHLSHNK